MNTNVHIHITSTTLAAALRVLTCSRTLNAAASQDSECGCKSISSEFKIQKLDQQSFRFIWIPKEFHPQERGRSTILLMFLIINKTRFLLNSELSHLLKMDYWWISFHSRLFITFWAIKKKNVRWYRQCTFHMEYEILPHEFSHTPPLAQTYKWYTVRSTNTQIKKTLVYMKSFPMRSATPRL